MSQRKQSTTSAWRLHGKQLNTSTPSGLKLLRLLFNSVAYLMPETMGRLALRLWFRTRRFTAPAREIRLLAEASEHAFHSHDKRIACWSWGKGPRVLLVHGWNGRGAQLGSFVPAFVEAGYRVMTLDLPGHGQTAGNQTNIFEISDALCDLNELHGPFAAVIAHSFGVPCVVHATKQGLQTQVLVSLSAPSGFNSLINHFARYLRLPTHMRNHIEQRLRSYIGADFWKQFADYYVPHQVARSLLIHDQDDHVVPLSEAQQLFPHWPGAEFMITAGLGHRRILKNREVIQRALAFIQDRQHGPEESQPQLQMASHARLVNCVK